jgi:hypothetical protein
MRSIGNRPVPVKTTRAGRDVPGMFAGLLSKTFTTDEDRASHEREVLAA